MGTKRPRVAVLDDDPEFAGLMEVLLEEDGFEPICPKIAEGDPVEVLAGGHFDLVILDVHGVGGDDLGLLQRLRADRRLADVPVLVCSADIQILREHAATLSAMPRVAALEKPFRIDTLSGAIHRLLERVAAGEPAPGRPDAQAVEAVSSWLADVGDRLLWPVLDAWMADNRPGLLRCVAAWCAAPEFEPFCRVSRRTHLPFGGGLPGRIWVSGRPAWIEELASDLNFPRLPAARQVGLVSAVATPVGDADQVIGVVAAYTRMRRAHDASVVDRLRTEVEPALPLFRALATSRG